MPDNIDSTANSTAISADLDTGNVRLVLSSGVAEQGSYSYSYHRSSGMDFVRKTDKVHMDVTRRRSRGRSNMALLSPGYVMNRAQTRADGHATATARSQLQHPLESISCLSLVSEEGQSQHRSPADGTAHNDEIRNQPAQGRQSRMGRQNGTMSRMGHGARAYDRDHQHDDQHDDYYGVSIDAGGNAHHSAHIGARNAGAANVRDELVHHEHDDSDCDTNSSDDTWKVQLVNISDDSTISSNGTHTSLQDDHDGFHDDFDEAIPAHAAHSYDYAEPRASLIHSDDISALSSPHMRGHPSWDEHDDDDAMHHPGDGKRPNLARHVRFDDTATARTLREIPSWRIMKPSQRKRLWYTRKEIKTIHRQTADLARDICRGRKLLERGLEIQSGVTVLTMHSPPLCCFADHVDAAVSATDPPHKRGRKGSSDSNDSFTNSGGTAFADCDNDANVRLLKVYSRRARIQNVRSLVMAYQAEFQTQEGSVLGPGADTNTQMGNINNQPCALPSNMDDDTVFYNTTLAQLYMEATERCKTYSAILGLYDQKEAKDVYFHQRLVEDTVPRQQQHTLPPTSRPFRQTAITDLEYPTTPQPQPHSQSPSHLLSLPLPPPLFSPSSVAPLRSRIKKTRRTTKSNSHQNLQPGHSFEIHLHDKRLRESIRAMLTMEHSSATGSGA